MQTLHAKSYNQGKCRFSKVCIQKGARRKEQWLGLEKVRLLQRHFLRISAADYYKIPDKLILKKKIKPNNLNCLCLN